jgi:cytochrome P450
MRLTDFSTPAFFDNPYPLYEKLRAAGPLVSLSPTAMISGRYEVVDAILHDRRMGKDYIGSVRLRYGDDAVQMPLFQGISRMFLVMNAPAHTRLRALMMKAFNARQVESIRKIAQDAAHDLIDGFEAKGKADLTSQFAFPLPVGIVSKMLDIPMEDALGLGDAISRVAKSFDSAPIDAESVRRGNVAYEDLARYFSGVIVQRSARLGDDLISMLLSVEEGGEKLSHDEIVSNVILLFLAGHETTSNMIGNALISLHRHPEQLALLRSDLSKMSNAVLECVRYEGSVQSVVRSALEDIEIAGVELPRGTMVVLSIASANRDPLRFQDPDRLDIDRDGGRLASFGAGIHYCLGYRLALIELETALGVLFERLPGLELLKLGQLTWNQRGNLRGVESLEAVW